MTVYLDTSALRHVLVRSRHTDHVTARMRVGPEVPFTSSITITELHRLSLREAEVSADDVEAVLDRVEFLVLTRDRLRAAGLLPHLPSGGQLRSLDALHIQSALDARASEFVTSDVRQAAAARAVGLSVVLLPSD